MSGDSSVPRRKATDIAARALLVGLLSRMRDGAVIVEDNGRRHLCGRPAPGEIVPEVELQSPQAWRAVATGGSAGLGRTYVEGGWRTRDLDQLTLFLRVIFRNLDPLEQAGLFKSRLAFPLRRIRRRLADRSDDLDIGSRNLDGHLSIAQEMYALFLDESMTYSSAIFLHPNDTLYEAQTEKLDRLCRKLSLSPVDEVLEIGTGWGSFAIHAASKYGCRVTTLTTSAEQFNYASERVRNANLGDLVTVANNDYRNATGAFDKLISIESEQVLNSSEHDTFFRHCARLLKSTGLMAIQAVTVADRYVERAQRTDDFVKRYVLAGASLPSVGTLVQSASRASDLQMVALEDIGRHSVETFRRWRVGFFAHRDQLAAMSSDERFDRLLAFYLCYCEAAFAERRISDVQCLFARPSWRQPGLHTLVKAH